MCVCVCVCVGLKREVLSNRSVDGSTASTCSAQERTQNENSLELTRISCKYKQLISRASFAIGSLRTNELVRTSK